MFPFLFTGDPESRVGIRVHSNRNGPINNAQGPFTDHTQNSTTSGRTQFHHLFKILLYFFWGGGDFFDIFFGVQSQSGQPYVVVLASYTLVGPTFLLNYITRLLRRPHKSLLSNHHPYLGSCKWQPPWSPFASALVMDWYQYSGCRATHVCGAPL